MGRKIKTTRFWCDDMRTPIVHNDWTICRSVEAFKVKFLRNRIVEDNLPFVLALDNDAGSNKNQVPFPEFYLVMNWLEQQELYPTHLYILTSNPYARQRIQGYVKSAERRNVYINVLYPTSQDYFIS